MIILDFDSIKKNPKSIPDVCRLLQLVLTVVPNAEKLTFAPTQAIYWFSKKSIKEHDLEMQNLPTVGANFAKKNTLIEYLKWMVKDINRVSVKNGMGKFVLFKNTTVVTDSDILEIEKLGAKVILVSSLGGV